MLHKEYVIEVTRLLDARHAEMAEELRQRDATISTLKTKINKLTRQRDEALGRASEYRGYATKYQRELAELRSSRNA